MCIYIYTNSTGHNRLQEILEGHRTVAQLAKLLWRIPVVRTLRKLALPLCIDPLVVEHHHKKRKDTYDDETELESMSENVARRILRSVEVGSHGLRKSVLASQALSLRATYLQQGCQQRFE